MKYIVITAKPHDGFRLFPSDVTTYDIARFGPSNEYPQTFHDFVHLPFPPGVRPHALLIVR